LSSGGDFTAAFAYDVSMSDRHLRVTNLVLQRLSSGETRLLSLIVGLRRSLEQTELFHGDLPAITKAVLRRLVADGEVFDLDGVYSLRRPVHSAG
jgi:hypothetical protein